MTSQLAQGALALTRAVRVIGGVMRIEDLNLPADVVDLIRATVDGDEVAAARLPDALRQVNGDRQAKQFQQRLFSWLEYTLRSDEDGGAIRYSKNDEDGVLPQTPDTCEQLNDLPFVALVMNGDGIVVELPGGAGRYEFYIQYSRVD